MLYHNILMGDFKHKIHTSTRKWHLQPEIQNVSTLKTL